MRCLVLLSSLQHIFWNREDELEACAFNNDKRVDMMDADVIVLSLRLKDDNFKGVANLLANFLMNLGNCVRSNAARA